MSDVIITPEMDTPGPGDVSGRGVPPASPGSSSPSRLALGSSVVAFVVFAAVVLSRSSALLEPDDLAYRASLVALRHGEVLLTNAQYLALKSSLGLSQGTLQWHHMATGYWISEKNPGYPFVAFVFYVLGLLRLAPLFFGALACTGLYLGVGRWVSRRAGALAVWLYCFSGAALTFAWRATMPSFTDASLIAAGFGALVWTLLAVEASARRRHWVGLASFVLIELAVFIRYTDVIELAVAVVAVALLARGARLRRSALVSWGVSLVVLAALVLGFDQWAYGSATSTGYSSGEITFSLSALWPNLKGMPAHLTSSMPLWLFAGAALVALARRALRRTTRDLVETRRDTKVAAILAAGWLGLWALYLCYTWTANMVSGGRGGGPGGGGGGGVTVHVIRFYLPALGLVAMLAAWLISRFWRPAMIAVVALLVVASLFSFSSMAGSGAIGAGGGPGGGPGGPPPSGVTGVVPGAGPGQPPGAGTSPSLR